MTPLQRIERAERVLRRLDAIEASINPDVGDAWLRGLQNVRYAMAVDLRRAEAEIRSGPFVRFLRTGRWPR